ncbi:hypothetical protein E1A91_A08G114800v1 [Gossypium mustelinum]|uniref:Uncharacterized protein n=1 Tax=Gossypium mustelinum TaxID=34275 RepID=A0A5D2Y876_GOSMU|nr:hypothetical protein E1A91_A08G114800v1 [Gossypium mustelinum]
MNLKEPLWSKRTESNEPPSPSSSLPRDPESEAAAAAATSAVEELVNSLNKQRIYREVTLALRNGLRDVRAEFSFFRVRGFRSLTPPITLFSQTQSIPDLQEVALALRVLEGCCLLHPESTRLAHQHKAIPVLMNVLSTRGVLEQGACLDALISILLDSSANQMDFEACNGIEEVAELIRDKQVDENLRYLKIVIEMWRVLASTHWACKWEGKVSHSNHS